MGLVRRQIKIKAAECDVNHFMKFRRAREEDFQPMVVIFQHVINRGLRRKLDPLRLFFSLIHITQIFWSLAMQKAQSTALGKQYILEQQDFIVQSAVVYYCLCCSQWMYAMRLCLLVPSLIPQDRAVALRTSWPKAHLPAALSSLPFNFLACLIANQILGCQSLKTGLERDFPSPGLFHLFWRTKWEVLVDTHGLPKRALQRCLL